MIDQAMLLVRNTLRQFIRLKLQIDQIEEKVVLTSVIDQNGQSTIPLNSLGITLYRIVEDRVVETEYQPSIAQSEYEKILPPVILSLEIVIAANFNDYTESLKYISAAMACFQSKNYFDHSNCPEMNKDMNPFGITLFTQNVSEHNHTWSLFGGRYMPSVMYRLRSIEIQEQMIEHIDSVVESIDIIINNRDGGDNDHLP
ncbi:hypothetical protein BTA51_09380 [Hahella sp. CCB-MM4]|uniref:DUF4255 domain-containing protein n=1 Tax=Hahella sp. (strain CCB-MM4) TaxID=1926491 RepID=UPI000B9BB73A|nr:DUF4255 domain-containing protein [Hahella sp. CCB-MM4]OZG73981.1 hypothetical protein BTA51_09380 [Hahella sp. CCB-MM4]